jgi:hypothetical protein
MNYQVMLTDDADVPLASQSVELVFRLYYTESGGSPFWTETHSLETNSIGVVSVALGSINPFTSYAFVPQWLEVQVNGEVMSPRRELLEAPFARVAMTADLAFSADELGYIPADAYALYSVLSGPGTINLPTNPLEWTRLKNVPPGFADGVDDGGVGDGHSLDASDGNPTDVVRVDDVGMVESGFSSELADLMSFYGQDYALDVGGANVWGGILAETQSTVPFEVGVLGGAKDNAGVLGAAYDTVGYMFLIDGKSGVAGSVQGAGYAGSFIADNDEDEAIFCTNMGQGDVLHAYGWSADCGYTGYFEGGEGVLIEGARNSPSLVAWNMSTIEFGDAAAFRSEYGVSSSTKTLSAGGYQGNAAYFTKITDDDEYAAAIYGASSSSEGLYVSGSIYSTVPFARGVETGRGTEAVFGVSAADVEVIASGQSRLQDGAARVEFDRLFAESIAGGDDLRVTVSPVGAWSAVYVAEINDLGFDVRSDAGDREVEFHWMAVGRAKGHQRRPGVTIPDDEADRLDAEQRRMELEARRPEGAERSIMKARR